MTTGTNVPLSPISFLERAGDVFADKPATITSTGSIHTYDQLRLEARRLAEGIRRLPPSRRETVAVLAKNSPDLLRMHFGVPGARSTLVALNTRLDPTEYEYILSDCGAGVLFVDPTLDDRIRPVADRLACEIVTLPHPDTGAVVPGAGTPYEVWLDDADSTRPLALPSTENDPISINYTSGTTGRPKGAVYTHRGAYLNALGVALELGLGSKSTYLWTLPMFHCNGWSCTWGATAVGATHVTLSDFDPAVALDLLDRHNVTHLCGAPVVLNALADQGAESARSGSGTVKIATGGAPPSPATISSMGSLGIDVIHLYGLTETYGPSVICEIQPGWSELDPEGLAEVLARQGVRTITVEGLRVVDDNFDDVPADGESMGEIVVRSNTVVPKYHDDAARTSESFRDGWLLTGDLAVMHEDGYVEVRDRRKDIIISGGENISSIEVENVLSSHADVSEAAVVASEHDKWGEVPVAFVSLRQDATVTEQELIEYVRDRLAHFKAPKAVVFCELPKTSTGKVQKPSLRERARSVTLP